MYALITGASSGIGMEMAKELAKRGYDLILIGRNYKALKALAEHVDTAAIILTMDLSRPQNCLKAYNAVKNKPIGVVINNAGFGSHKEFLRASTKTDMNMIDVNLRAVHLLTKLFLKKLYRQNYGYILNVASLAAFAPGPYMSTYYATKAYVYSLTASIYEEIRRSGKNVHISVLCPGPVSTNFNKRAGVDFSIKPVSAEFVAKKAIRDMLRGKLVIFPKKTDALIALGAKIAPVKISARVVWEIQNKKLKGSLQNSQKN